MSGPFPLLDQIDGPQDLKGLSRRELKTLCQEIRELLIDVISTTGGHLGPNLGVVELSVALHTILESPKDKVIWDVSHQSYVHKLLTGRRDRIHTLRQFKGLSGFQKRAESEHDAFGAGHAGTSISAALGMAAARDLKGGDDKIVAVIGDGSMTAGMAFEALNHGGDLNPNMLVVLNDNEMSISKNVGSLSSYLSRILTGEFYTRMREETENIVSHIPRVGKSMLKVAKKAEEAVKVFITPGVVFEELGFQYVGPIDGHNLDHLIPTLENLVHLKGPVLLHVVTKKGKGYSLAEDNPVSYHGTPKFDKTIGVQSAPNPLPAYTKVFGDAMLDLAAQDEKVLAITAAMAPGTGLVPFSEQFPKRFYDVGIAEQHAVTFAAGMATQGFKPVVTIYSTFMQRAYDQVIHDVALQQLPVTFAMDRAGLVGDDGPTHHGVFDLSFMRSIPNLTFMVPRDGASLRNMMYTASQCGGPAAVRYPRGAVPSDAGLNDEFEAIPLSQAEQLRAGTDATVIALGNMVQPALEAAATLNDQHGINTRVIDARFVKPIDREMILKAAAETGVLITVEENALAGGFGSAVLECLEEAGVTVPVRRLGIPDHFVEQGPQDRLRADLGLDADGIIAAVRAITKTRATSQAMVFGA